MSPLIILRWCLLVSFLNGFVQIQAQENSAILVPDNPITFTLTGDGPTTFIYESPGHEFVRITARTLHELAEDEQPYVRDTIIAVWNATDEQIAYNDDHLTTRPGLLPSDSVIDNLRLQVPGKYQILVNTYGGISATEVEVLLEIVDPFETEIVEGDNQTTITGRLYEGSTYVYEFDAEDPITITARDVSHTLDPVLRLYDEQGSLIAWNDDHHSDDLTLNVLDAQIADFQIAVSGRYRLELTDFLGRSGDFFIVIPHATDS